MNPNYIENVFETSMISIERRRKLVSRPLENYNIERVVVVTAGPLKNRFLEFFNLSSTSKLLSGTRAHTDNIELLRVSVSFLSLITKI